MPGLVLATCDRALGPSGTAPEWVHLLPDGKMTGRDGRSFDLADAAGLVLAFQSNGIDLPIDDEHQNDKPEARLSGPVPAAGWIKELRADDSGLWGRVEWTATAREMIRRKEYRSRSPSFLFNPKTRQILRLKGAGLVHNPNLHLTALASQETDMPPQAANPKPPETALADLAAQLAKLLGLPADATPEELIAKLAAKLTTEPDPASSCRLPPCRKCWHRAARNIPRLPKAPERKMGHRKRYARWWMRATSRAECGGGPWPCAPSAARVG